MTIVPVYLTRLNEIYRWQGRKKNATSAAATAPSDVALYRSRNEGLLLLRLLMLCLAALPLVGCASLSFKPGVQSIGEYRDTSAVAEKADAMAVADAADVKVLLEALPDGMSIKDNDIQFDSSRYDLLGKVSAQYNYPGWAALGMWFYDYNEDEKWRSGLCSWQVPLSWLTIGMWAVLSPLAYPCKPAAGSDEARRAHIVQALQKATKALGGNLVVVAGFGGLNFIHGASGLGYAFRVKHGPSAVPPNQVRGDASL